MQLSYAALGDLLEDVLPATLEELPPPRRHALEIALLLEDAHGRPPDQRGIGLAVLGALRALASSSPLLVAIDDAQWLDAPTAAVLEFALRRLRREPVGVLVAGRTAGGLELSPALPVERLRVGPLNEAAIHRDRPRAARRRAAAARARCAFTRRAPETRSMRSSWRARSAEPAVRARR